MIHRLSLPHWLKAATLAVLTQIPADATATVVPVSQSRQVSVFAFLDTGSGAEPLRCDKTIESDQDGPFSEQSSCHVEQGGSYVSAHSNQTSTIGPDGVSAALGISAEGRLVFPAQGSLGIASSGVIFDFDVDVPTPCRIVANVEAAGDAVVDIALRIRGGLPVVQWQLFDTQQNLDHLETLPPGEYELTVGGGGDGATGPNGTGSSLATVDCAMSFPVAGAAPVATAPPAAPAASPNPTRGTVTLSPSSSFGGPVMVFDAAGRLVRDLGAENGRPIVWDARDRRGAPVPCGVYLVRWSNGSVRSVTVSR